jgi:hypothetical protein
MPTFTDSQSRVFARYAPERIIYGKVKVNFTLEHAMKTQERGRGIGLLFL